MEHKYPISERTPLVIPQPMNQTKVKKKNNV